MRRDPRWCCHCGDALDPDDATEAWDESLCVECYDVAHYDATGWLDDDTLQPCGHPWSAVVWFEDETGDCGACLAEERRQHEEAPHAHER